MRVMTYNMLHAPGDRLQALLAVVREAAPDVLACQEIDDVAGLLELSLQLEMPAVVGHSNRPESPPDPEHVAILSRWPIERIHVHRGDPEAMFRPVLEVWVAPPDGGLVGFFTVHFRARPGAPGSEVKQREARHMADVLAQASGRFCALGDFNAWAPGEGELSADRLANLPEDHRAAVRGGVIGALLALDLTDTWKQCHPAPEPIAPTLRDSATSRVDYILASRALATSVRTSDVIRSSFTATASDHYPLLTTFTLAARPHVPHIPSAHPTSRHAPVATGRASRTRDRLATPRHSPLGIVHFPENVLSPTAVCEGTDRDHCVRACQSPLSKPAQPVAVAGLYAVVPR